jgi:tRNA 5-methylaminomethyl-2-thiouridine biosynthesis bifunctional protein
MPNNIVPSSAEVRFDDDSIPTSVKYTDSYYSKSGGYDEAYSVYIKGCNLPEAWQGLDKFVIAELGFGTGLNFLCVWELWNKTRPKNGILHFISFEQFPLVEADCMRALSNWPQLAFLKQKLLRKWPKRANGLQRIWFAEDRVCLTLIIGDATKTLPKQDFAANAWFLDGFSPKTNPELWSVSVLSEVRRLSKAGARIGTYTVAKTVRDNLQTVGFSPRKCEGFGRKRERLEAFLDGSSADKSIDRPKSALIIGGGIAGSAIAFALSHRDVECTIIDDDEKGIIKASNNMAGLIMPRLDRLNSKEARFFRAAFIDALCVLDSLEHFVKSVKPFSDKKCDQRTDLAPHENSIEMALALVSDCFDQTGVIELPRSIRDQEKFEQFEKDAPLPSEMLSFKGKNLYHKSGGIVYPSNILNAMTQMASKIYDKIAKVEKNSDGKFQANNISGEPICSADICIIANGQGIHDFLDVDQYALDGRAGVVCFAKADWPENELPIGGKSYCLPHESGVLFGATFVPQKLNEKATVLADSFDRNLELLREYLPNLATKIDRGGISGRASMRVVTKDRMPIAGQIPEIADLYVLGALGSRGFSTASICAEVIASMACGDPMPLERELLDLIAPMRFAK